MNQLQQLWQRPQGKIFAGIAAVVVIGLVVGGMYIFGGGSPAHNKLTTATFAPTADGTIFTIDDSSSNATFTISEMLFGNPNTVVGKTSDVSGQILINKTNASTSQIGEIKIDLSTMKTDNNLRNNALQGRIFETSDASNQFATFVTKTITGLPTTVAVGQTVNFTITGDLTLHGVTKSEIFAATVTATSATEITGSAKTTVKYSDFNLSIPPSFSATNIAEDVELAINFTAKAS